MLARALWIGTAALAVPFFLVQAEELSPTLAVEQAPRELGQFRSESFVLIAADRKAKELYVFDNADRSLSRFTETGERWGDPVTLGSPSEALNSSPEPPQALRIGGAGIAIMTPSGVIEYGLDGNVEASRRVFMPADLAALKSGWALSLVNLRTASGKFAARKSFGDRTPRLVTIGGEDLGTDYTGIYEDDEIRGGGASAGRGLLLASAGSRLYAVERAAYRVHELTRKLSVVATYTEPKWGGDADDADIEPSEETREALAELVTQAKSTGRNVGGQTKSQRRPGPPMGGDLSYKQVARAVAWSGDRLVILLDRGIADRDRPALDLLDPVTGEGRRFALAGLGDAQISQLTIGHRWIWLRARSGSVPIYRIDALALVEGGTAFKVSDIWRNGELEPETVANEGG